MHTKNNNPIALGYIYSNPKNIFMNGRGCVYHSNGIAPTILTMSGGGTERMDLFCGWHSGNLASFTV